MDDIYARNPLVLSSSGTLCAACQARDIWTDHSPAGEQHKAWEARWAEDPQWKPEDATDGETCSRPAFGDFVATFTPPGTDFEAFKTAMHSQGAPGMISPEMVGILNHIAPQMMGDTSSRCFRCEHPHGGPPGAACLEAEAHLGRSPSRRSPDLQLDAISAPSRKPASAQPTLSADTVTPGVAAATALRGSFLDLLAAGFTEDQALTFLAKTFVARVQEGQPDG